MEKQRHESGENDEATFSLSLHKSNGCAAHQTPETMKTKKMEAVTHAETLFAKSPDVAPPILNVVLGVALLTTEAFAGPLPRKLLRHFR